MADGRTAVVTGAAQGLGEAIARRLAQSDVRVVVADINEDRARAVADDLPDGHTVAVDVSDPAALRAVLEDADERFGGVDILVNNAGRTVMRSFWDITVDEWDAVLDTNLRSVFVACQVIGARMRERGHGRIVNMASLAGQQGGTVGGTHYAASKAGIVVLTKIVAAELAPHGVTVNAVSPAAIAGPIMDSLPKERVDALASRIPVQRVGRPEEVAALVAHVVSDEAGYITGATLDINGGLLMR